MAFSADARRQAAPRLALVAVAALLAGGFAAGPETTAATLTGTATATSSISTREACLGEAQAYTSGLLDQAKPALRWNFSDGVLPGDAPAKEASLPEADVRGLLQCDPAGFPDTKAAPGSIRLDRDGTAGLAVASQPLTTSFTLLLWVSPDAKSEGELAALSNSTGDLALGLSGATASLSFPGGEKAATLAIPTTDPGRSHLVAMTFDGGALTLTVDGVTTERVPTTWSPVDLEAPSALTVGARTGHTSPGALVDEVTLLAGPASADWLQGLVTSDRWWVPADWKAGSFAAPEPAPAAPSAPVVAGVVTPTTPTPAPSSSPTTPTAGEPTSDQTTTPQTTTPQTTELRRSRSTTSRHTPSR